MPKPKNTSWKTVMLPKTDNKNYKVWAIIATISTTVMAVAVTILAIALAITVGEVNRLESEQQTTSETQPVDVDVSKLDKSKLITEADLPDGEIPDHYIGNKNAKVVVIEYEDFACLHCQALAYYAEQIHADYQNRVLFIYRNFNVSHPNSARTLRAAEAAYQLGGEEAYWAMAKLLYQDTRWTGAEVFGSQSILNDYARQIGLDADEFGKTVSETAVVNKVARDKELGSAAGVNGTPTWLINGQPVAVPRDAEIRAALDALL